ncbi:MAG: DinB family protein [Chloroflexi bacterium]|nr:DinB family protein [Chloroflexota bacterium]
MAKLAGKIDVYIETGSKKTFASALDWPGWARSGSDEAAAVQALMDYGTRYAQVLARESIPFKIPVNAADFQIVERMAGGSGTDFGVPGEIPPQDLQPVGEEEHRRFHEILKACWQAVDSAVQAAAGKELRKGPRGGGRELEGILRHVLDAEAGYLSQLGWKIEKVENEALPDQLARTRQAVLDGLAAAVRGELPEKGPRGGKRWPVRYFVRRTAWHALDHAWEIEDRAL